MLAKLSALMESVETWHVEQPMVPVLTAAPRDVRRDLGYDVMALPRSEPSLLHAGLPLDWLPARSLLDGAETLVPLALVALTLEQRQGWNAPVFFESTNGLASGNTLVEASLHALYEVIERDAVTAALTGGREMGVRVDPLTSGSAIAADLCARIERAGVTLETRLIPSPTGLPCFLAWVSCDDYPAAMYGFGCHRNADIALSRAVTEAAQARLAYISGARDDLQDDIAQPGAVGRRAVSGTAADIGDLVPPPVEGTSLLDDLEYAVACATAAFGHPPLVVDLTRNGIGVPVVKVVAPGARVCPEVLYVEKQQVVVYAGPTIGAADIRSIIPDAEVRVPVARGDLMEGPWRPGDTAVLIDGFFRERRSVGHKEILWLLGQGVDVIGTASMGALRAAELAPHGMRGLGTVYCMYASGAIDADDEVGVLHGPAVKGYPAQTVALVNLRFGAAEGARSGLVPEAAGRRIIEAAKALPFTSRSWSDLDSAIGDADREALRTLRRLIEAGDWDIKRRDATEALRSIGTGPAAAPVAVIPDVFLTGIANGQRISRQSKREYAPGRWMTDLDVLDAARLFDDAYPELHREVLSGLLAEFAAAEGRTLSGYAEHRLGVGTGPLPDQLASWLTEPELARMSPEERVVAVMVQGLADLAVARLAAGDGGPAARVGALGRVGGPGRPGR